MSKSINKDTLHKLVQPLSWLLGRWRSVKPGVVQYPTMPKKHYVEEVEFFHVGQRSIQYSFYSSTAESNKPMHREVGFIRTDPNSNKIAFISAHNLGVTEVQEGTCNGEELTVETVATDRMSFATDVAATRLVRKLTKRGDTLEQLVHMETKHTPLTEHLRITFKKVE